MSGVADNLNLLNPAAESLSHGSVRIPAEIPAVVSPDVTPDASAQTSRLTTVVALTGFSACACYFSAFLHLLAYGIAGALFYWLGLNVVDDSIDKVTPLAASLADETVEDDSARLELAADVSMGENNQPSNAQQLANFLKTSEKGWIETLETDALQSVAASDADLEKDGGQSGLMFKVPASGLAVTKGSFTAWTEPSDPKPGQKYVIIIEIRLPDDVQRYRLNDLVGEVEGSDRYRQKIPYDARAPYASAVGTPRGIRTVDGSDSVDVVKNKVQLAISVPGAGRLVKDTIRIRSRRLKEEQELTLVFQGKPTEP